MAGGENANTLAIDSREEVLEESKDDEDEDEEEENQDHDENESLIFAIRRHYMS